MGNCQWLQRVGLFLNFQHFWLFCWSLWSSLCYCSIGCNQILSKSIFKNSKCCKYSMKIFIFFHQLYLREFLFNFNSNALLKIGIISCQSISLTTLLVFHLNFVPYPIYLIQSIFLVVEWTTLKSLDYLHWMVLYGLQTIISNYLACYTSPQIASPNLLARNLPLPWWQVSFKLLYYILIISPFPFWNVNFDLFKLFSQRLNQIISTLLQTLIKVS